MPDSNDPIEVCLRDLREVLSDVSLSKEDMSFLRAALLKFRASILRKAASLVSP